MGKSIAEMTDRELDQAVAEDVMHPKPRGGHSSLDNMALANRGPWCPSTDISAAWQVFEKMRETLACQIKIDTVGFDGEPFRVLIGWGDDPVSEHAECAIAPRAICEAALAAARAIKNPTP